MGRRKKAPGSVHRETIAAAAEQLFAQKGTEATTVEEIAKEAGYSKATLYVYFQNKEEIIAFLVLKSMEMLSSCVSEAVSGQGPSKEKYRKICDALTQYQEQYPLYFSLALGKINVNFEESSVLPVEKEIYEVGEQINSKIAEWIRAGIGAGEFQPDQPVRQTVFLFWAALSGLIQMAANKQAYIRNEMGLSKQEFLEYGFEQLYRLIAAEGTR